MILANELRIGNYVMGDGKWVKLLTIGSKDMEFIFSSKCQPIPLTPEILEKAGFEFVNGYMVNKSKEMCHVVLIEAGDLFKTSVTGPFGMVSTKSLSYVHQLQNLYYSLTGEELTIQL